MLERMYSLLNLGQAEVQVRLCVLSSVGRTSVSKNRMSGVRVPQGVLLDVKLCPKVVHSLDLVF